MNDLINVYSIINHLLTYPSPNNKIFSIIKLICIQIILYLIIYNNYLLFFKLKYPKIFIHDRIIDYTNMLKYKLIIIY